MKQRFKPVMRRMREGTGAFRIFFRKHGGPIQSITAASRDAYSTIRKLLERSRDLVIVAPDRDRVMARVSTRPPRYDAVTETMV